jgi:hypothetical protein
MSRRETGERSPFGKRQLTSVTVGDNTRDQSPRHVHVYRDGQLIVKWDLDNHKAMKGRPTPRILELIAGLAAEGLL